MLHHQAVEPAPAAPLRRSAGFVLMFAAGFAAIAVTADALRLVPLLPAVPIAALLWPLGDDLLSGTWIGARPWVAAARAGWRAAAVVVPLGASLLCSFLLERASEAGAPPPRRWPRAVATALLAAWIPAAIVMDATVYPGLYDAAHRALWLSVLAAAGLLACFRAFAVPTFRHPRASLVGASVVLALAASALLGLPPRNDTSARATAYRATLFLRRALPWFVPLPPERAPVADAATLARLRGAARWDSGELDRLLPGRRSWNVAFLTVDALRADRLGAQGNGRVLTPRIDALGESCQRFSEAWTPFPLTHGAFTAVFRGVHPDPAGILRSEAIGAAKEPFEERPPLADLLRRADWRTDAVTGFRSDLVTTPFRSLFEGFERSVALGERNRGSADAVAAEALEALARNPERPHFLWAHFVDPHDVHPTEQGTLWGGRDRDHYDGRVQHADRALGRLLDGIESLGLLERTLLVVFADHGREFEDDGAIRWGLGVTTECVHVPLLLRIPGVPGRTLPIPVDLTAVLPTVLELLARPAPAGLHGHSLVPLLFGPGNPAGPAGRTPTAFSRIETADVSQSAVREGDLALIWNDREGTTALYDLATDPDEKHDLSLLRPLDLDRLLRVRDAYRVLLAAPDPPASK